MKITSTTLRRIIKEELDAVMNEDRAEHVAGIEAKIKRLEAEIERAQERRDEIGYDPAADDPRTSKTYRELGVRIENMEDKLEVLRQQRAELSMNEEDAMSAVAAYDATMKPQGDGVVFDLDAMRDAKASFVELIKGLNADQLQDLKVVLTPAHPLYDEVALANIDLAKARGN